MDRIQEQRKRFNEIYNERESLYRIIEQKSNLPEIPYRILYSLCEEQLNWSQIDICRRWNYPKTSVHSAIEKLVKLGYVSLVQDKTAPRNRKIIELTDAGKAYCEQWVLPAIDADIQAFAELTEEDRNFYIDCMERQCESVKERLKDMLYTGQAEERE